MRPSRSRSRARFGGVHIMVKGGLPRCFAVEELQRLSALFTFTCIGPCSAHDFLRIAERGISAARRHVTLVKTAIGE